MSNKKRQLLDFEIEESRKLKEIYTKKKKELGLSQERLAILLGISQGAVNHYLNGTNALNLPIAAEFAKALNIPISTFSWRLEKELKEMNLSLNIGDISGNTISGNNNIGGTQNNYALFEGKKQIPSSEELDASNAKHLKSMPLMDINLAAQYLATKNEDRKQIYDLSEMAATFIPHSSEAIGIRIADDSLSEFSRDKISKGDVLIIEPKIPPRDGDLILLCLNNTGYWRGMVCRLFISIDGKRKVKCDEGAAILLPTGSLIGGVVIELKRRLIPTDLLESRISKDYDIQQSIELN